MATVAFVTEISTTNEYGNVSSGLSSGWPEATIEEESDEPIAKRTSSNRR
jgi:hypothetical protein